MGEAGNKIIIEECLEGQEASILVITDSRELVALASAQDHKRVFDHDQGPNTGGMGVYSPTPVITPDIFDALEKTKLGKDNELWLVDAIGKMVENRPVYAKIIDGQVYDLGNKFGWLKANVEFGLKDKEIKDDFKHFLKSLK